MTAIPAPQSPDTQRRSVDKLSASTGSSPIGSDELASISALLDLGISDVEPPGRPWTELYLEALAEPTRSQVDEIIADHLRWRLRGWVASRCDALTHTSTRSATARAMLHDLADEALTSCAAGQHDGLVALFLGENLRPSDSLQTYNERMLKPAMVLLTQLVLTAAETIDERSALLAVTTIAGQILILQSARPSLYHLLQIECFNKDEIELERVLLHQNVEATLNALTERDQLRAQGGE